MQPESVDDETSRETAAGLHNLLSNGINALSVSPKYIQPPEERPDLSTAICDTIPVIDLKGADIQGEERAVIVQQISRASQDYGCFQIINHGVPEEVIQMMIGVAEEFFEMPVGDRAKLYSEDTSKSVLVGTSFNKEKNKAHFWRDFLRHSCHPLQDNINLWPDKPENYREIAGRYAVEIRWLVLKLLGILSEGLGLETGYLDEKFGKHGQVLLINFYPACPDPSVTVGLPRHSDPGGITVLLQGDARGLQVMKDGNWIMVDPILNAFVVNLGDQVEVISNGKFKSVEHRATTNSSTNRISVVTFYGPSMDAFIAPSESLVNEHNPPHYKGYRYDEFLKAFWDIELRRKSLLDHFRV